MILYLDTSALVKRYIRETYSDDVLDLMNHADFIGASILTKVEMAAAFAKAARLGWVSNDTARQSWQDFIDEWPNFTRLSFSTALLDRASILAWDDELRGYDAMHLASAIIWQETLGAPITLATFDRNLWLAGVKEQLQVWPGGLYI